VDQNPDPQFLDLDPDPDPQFLDVDQNPDPQFLDLDQDPDPENFYCPAWLISLSIKDISSYNCCCCCCRRRRCCCYYLRRRLSLYHTCDSTTIRLRYDDATTHSTTTEGIEITICVRFNCDTTTTRLRRKKLICLFLLTWNRVEWKQALAIRRSRIAVESNANRNFDHFRHCRMRRGIVVS